MRKMNVRKSLIFETFYPTMKKKIHHNLLAGARVVQKQPTFDSCEQTHCGAGEVNIFNDQKKYFPD